MATERQIRANRLNALKSTGPRTAEGKQRSSKNAALDNRLAGTVVLKGESVRRFNHLASALMLEFQPRTPAELALVQTMAVARWRLLRIWGIQTAGFELEMARTRRQLDSAAQSGAVLAAVTLRRLADTSDVLALQNRLEVAYDRQFTRALALLLKLRAAQTASPAPDTAATGFPFITGTWDAERETGPNSEPEPAAHPIPVEQLPRFTPPPAPCGANPISPQETSVVHSTQITLGPRADPSGSSSSSPPAPLHLINRRCRQASKGRTGALDPEE